VSSASAILAITVAEVAELADAPDSKFPKACFQATPECAENAAFSGVFAFRELFEASDQNR
jgi:hypothetical protein